MTVIRTPAISIVISSILVFDPVGRAVHGIQISIPKKRVFYLIKSIQPYFIIIFHLIQFIFNSMLEEIIDSPLSICRQDQRINLDLLLLA